MVDRLVFFSQVCLNNSSLFIFEVETSWNVTPVIPNGATLQPVGSAETGKQIFVYMTQHWTATGSFSTREIHLARRRPCNQSMEMLKKNSAPLLMDENKTNRCVKTVLHYSNDFTTESKWMIYGKAQLFFVKLVLIYCWIIFVYFD